MSRRTTARAIGALFIIATTAGILSMAFLGQTQGALLVLIMAAAIAMIPPVFYPVLKEHGEQLALGYVVFRTLEVVLILPAAMGPPQAAVYPMSSFFFCLSVLMLNGVLYRSSIIPRAISVWALAAVVPYLADALLVMFGVHDLSSPLHTVLIVPLMVNELALALWLLARGFTPARSRTAPLR